MEDQLKLAAEEFRKEIREFLHSEMEAYIKKLIEGKFYQNLVLEMEGGISEMYTAINEFKKTIGDPGILTGGPITEGLIADASDQLEAIVETTEEATNRIMDITEKNQDRISQVGQILAQLPNSDDVVTLRTLAEEMNQDFMSIMTSCSFQDLTGQHIKKVIDLIQRIEKQVLALLVSTGTKIKEKKAGKSDSEIEGSTKKALEKLKGSGNQGIDQAGVDELLASLSKEFGR